MVIPFTRSAILTCKLGWVVLNAYFFFCQFHRFGFLIHSIEADCVFRTKRNNEQNYTCIFSVYSSVKGLCINFFRKFFFVPFSAFREMRSFVIFRHIAATSNRKSACADEIVQRYYKKSFAASKFQCNCLFNIVYRYLY